VAAPDSMDIGPGIEVEPYATYRIHQAAKGVDFYYLNFLYKLQGFYPQDLVVVEVEQLSNVRLNESSDKKSPRSTSPYTPDGERGVPSQGKKYKIREVPKDTTPRHDDNEEPSSLPMTPPRDPKKKYKTK